MKLVTCVTAALVLTAPMTALVARGDEPPATLALCAGLAGADVRVCASTCKTWPASEACMMTRALGLAGIFIVDHAKKAHIDVLAAGKTLRVPHDLARRAMLYADYVGLAPHAWTQDGEAAPDQQQALAQVDAARARAEAFVEAGRTAEAAAVLEEALPILEQAIGPSHLRLVRARRTLADMHYRAGKPEVAITHLGAALTVAEGVYGADHPTVADLHEALGDLERAAGKLTVAQSHYEAALRGRVAVFGPEHRLVLASLDRLGAVAREALDLDAAMSLFGHALTLATLVQGPDSSDVAVCHNNLGATLLEMGRNAEAKQHLTEAIERKERLFGAADRSVAVSVDNLGLAVARLGDFATARAHHTRAIAALERISGAELDLATAYQNLATTELLAAQAGASVAAAQRAVELFTRAVGPTNVRTATAEARLATVLVEAGDLAAARPLAERALASHTAALGDRHAEVGRDLDVLATIAQRLGDKTTAAAQSRRALAILRGALGERHDETLACRTNLAHALIAIRQDAEATELLTSVVAIRRERAEPERLAEALEELGQVRVQVHDPQGARALAAEAATLYERALGRGHARSAAARGRLGAIEFECGDLRAAKATLTEAVAALEAALGPDHRAVTTHRMNLALVLSASGEGGKALAEQTAAAKAMRAAFDRDAAAFSNELQLLDHASEARVMFEALVTLSTGQPQLTFEAALTWQGAGTMAEQRWRARHAARKSPLAEPATPDAVCQALARDAASLVDYIWYRAFDSKRKDDPKTREDERLVARYAVIVVTPDGCAMHRLELGAASVVDAAVDSWRAAMSQAAACWASAGSCDPAYTALDRAAGAISGLIWSPVARVLPAGERVWIVPDGRLVEVGFDSLPGEGGRPLLESRAIGLLPYPAAAARPAAGGGGSGAFVAGDLDYDAAPLAPLVASNAWWRCEPGGCTAPKQPSQVTLRAAAPSSGACGYDAHWSSLVPTEVTAVAEQLGRLDLGGPVLLATGAQAGAETVRAALPGRRVIHLATHGFFASKERCEDFAWTEVSSHGGDPGVRTFIVDPARLSALAVSGANRGAAAGLVSARDIASLDLGSTELAVLSACETGLGRNRAGEGALGLGRAFLQAGARAAIVSLWVVPSDPTSQLFTRVYDAALAPTGASDPVTTLRRAKLDLIAQLERDGQRASPVLWGAFVPMMSGLPARSPP